MPPKKIILAGGTGFIGNYLKAHYESTGYEVLLISRQQGHIQWQDSSGIIAALEDSELLINLAGKSVDCRYNEKNKAEILRSRIETTKALDETVLACKNPPRLWINSSTATIYRHAEDRPMTERTGEIGSGFSVGIATSWEKAFFDFKLPGTRQIALRMAIVLGKNGGVMKPLVNLVRFGLGGKQGNGTQMFSWIHIADLLGIIKHIAAHEELAGIYNCSSPNPLSNQALMKTFRQVLHPPFGLPSPKWLLEIGAVFIRTETELVLKSRWVVPEKILESGYVFQYPEIEGALKNILDK